MISYPDNDLLKKLHEGNEEAFELIFFKYYNNLCIYANCLLKNKETAEEVVQDVFLKLWENRNKLDITISLRAYLYRAVHNKSINHINYIQTREKHLKNLTEDINRKSIVYPLSHNYPVANLISKELEEEIEKALDALPEKCRTVFELCKFENLSYKDVAKKMNISTNTVKTQMKRAFEKFREILKEYLPVILIFTFIYR
ncbi:MAG: RNA polymerase sigma-70 factor [Bacteroidales bacterium]|nr:MAG: RNA polymerase sigma-70 factor [Bacteroidales bacterium]